MRGLRSLAPCAVAAALAACERAGPHSQPAPPPIDAPTPAPPDAAPASPCEVALRPRAVPPDAAVVDGAGGSSLADLERSWKQQDRRERVLDRMPLDKLIGAAAPGELGDALVRRIEARGYDHYDRLAPIEQRILAYDELFGEVNNGGFDQYFFNSSGDHALEAQAAVAEIGPRVLVPIMDCALTAFPGGRPAVDRDRRIDQLDAWNAGGDPLLDSLDDAFFAVDEGDTALAPFAEQHVHELPSAVKPLR